LYKNFIFINKHCIKKIFNKLIVTDVNLIYVHKKYFTKTNKELNIVSEKSKLVNIQF